MWHEGMDKPLTPEGTEEPRGVLFLPLVAVDHASDPLAEVENVEVDNQTNVDPA
jgi:hypothetical protein